jgi:hypothetical protein
VNVDKIYGKEDLKVTVPSDDYDRSKQPENMEYLNYLSGMITNDARCIREIKSMISIAKAALNKQKTLFTSQLGLNLRKKQVKCYIWKSTALGGAEA